MTRKPRFSILQGRAVKDRRISDAQFRTLAALGTYTDDEGWCFPKLATIGADLSKSKQAVGRDILALKKLGYVQVFPQFYDDGGRRSSKYRLVFDLSEEVPPPSTYSPPPVNVDDSTPSTSLVDTPSTSEVDALTTHSNVPIEPRGHVSAEWDLLHGKPIQLSEAEKNAAVYSSIAERLERGLRRNQFPQSIQAQKVYRWIAEREAEGESLDKFIRWATRDERAMTYTYVYHQNPEHIRRDWPQAFSPAARKLKRERTAPPDLERDI